MLRTRQRKGLPSTVLWGRAAGAGVVAVLLPLLAAVPSAPSAAQAVPHDGRSTASTATTVGAARPIVVRAQRARAVIQRNPFRLSVQDGHGRTVLAEVAPSGTGTLTEPATVDPVAPGNDSQSTTSLYAPLPFLVGTEVVQQQPAGEWVGNLVSGQREGTFYSATSVRSVRRSGSSVRLTLNTSDPSGRTLLVSVTPHGGSAISVSVRPQPAAGVVEVGDAFASTTGEGFFGFGGRHDTLNQHGNVLSSFVNEENLAGKLGPVQAPGGLSMYPNGPDAAYYPQASFISSRGYGFFLDQPQLARFKLDADSEHAWDVSAVARRLHYVVAPGSPRRATRTLTAITGRQPAPPTWALGPMLDRLVKNANESYADYQGNLEADMRNIRRYHLPLRAYRIEGWGFPGGNHGLALHTWVHPGVQRRIVGELRRSGVHPLFYLRPWLAPNSAPVRHGYAIRDAQGNPDYVVGSGGSRFALVDFTNPAAVRWWQRQVRDVFNLGADGFMQDYGEQVLFDMHFHDGSTGVTEHDRYLVQYDRATRQEIVRYQRSHPHRHLWFFDRAGYTGAPGSAAYEGGNFPGDETTDWGHASGLKSLATDMLSRAIGGAYGYGTDIGGYLDYTTPPTSKELFLRWAEWAVFSPVFRLHGAGLTGTHTPWSYDARTVRIYDRLSRLHERAVPLIERLWRAADRTGVPVTQPLWFAHPRDRRGWSVDQEWLLGPHLLTAPVVTQGARSRHVYLPPGCWQTTVRGHRHRYSGRRTVTVPAALGTLPWFTTCGTHPLGPFRKQRL